MTAPRSTSRSTRCVVATRLITSRSCSGSMLALAATLIALGSGGCSASTMIEACETGTYDHDGSAATACVAWTTCRAGQYVSVAGTAASDQTCTGCASGTHTTIDDASSCASWTECVGGEYVSTVGSATTDGDPTTACVALTECVAGQSVSSDGDAITDRVCATCTEGTFSNATNAASCAKWRACGAGYVEGFGGTTTTDRTCIPDGWTRQFGTTSDDHARSVSVGRDGSVVVAGYTSGTLSGQSAVGGVDAFVRKYDATGNELWTRQFGSTSPDWGGEVSVGHDGSVLVVGTTDGSLPGQSSTFSSDAFVRKYDAAGNELWTRQFGNTGIDGGDSVSVGIDGSVLITGYTYVSLPGQSSAGGIDAFVRKYDAAGNEIWTRQFGSAGGDHTRSVSVGSDGSVLVAGYTEAALPGQSSSGDEDAFVRKYDAAGNELWTRQFGSAGDDHANAVTATSDGGVLVAGYAARTLPGQSSSGWSAFVRKYDAAGDELWTRQFGNANLDIADSVSESGDGSVFVVGATVPPVSEQPSAGIFDAFVRKYDAAGNELWTRQLRSERNDRCRSVSVGIDGSVLVAGDTTGTLPGQSAAGGADVFVSNLTEP